MKFKTKNKKKGNDFLGSSTSEDNYNQNKKFFKQNAKNKNSKNSYKKQSKTFSINYILIIPLFLLLIPVFSYFIFNLFKKRDISVISISEKKFDVNFTNKEDYSLASEKKEENYSSPYEKKESDSYKNLNYDFNSSIFNIINKDNCLGCGFFSYYLSFLGCFITSITSQKIPIIDLASYPNVFNEFNPNGSNPWEYFFEQAFKLSLKEVNEKAQIKKNECDKEHNLIPNYKKIFYNQYSILFYHTVVTRYIPIKKEIMKEVYSIMKKLFKGSENVLGVLARGTDYVTLKNAGTPIPPTAEQMIEDVNKFDKENNYDYIFLATEDNEIKNKFKNEFEKKLKYIEFEKQVEYNYSQKEFFSSNKNAQGIDFQKIYLFNVIILSKCIDIISARTHGAAVAFILSEGFRKNLVYDLGEY